MAERVEIELGYEGGGVLRCLVARNEAEGLAEAFRREPKGLVSLASDKGRVVVDLRRIAYVHELSERRQLGFGG